MRFRIWCEFPDKVDWKKLAKWLDELDMNIDTYVTVSSLKKYKDWKKKIRGYSKRIEVNVWPTLPLNEGYWFSSQTSKKSIDQLDQFKGLKIKIDLEAPIYQKGFLLGALHMVPSMLIAGRNKSYLQEKIKKLSKTTKIILSTGQMPRFMLNNWGFFDCDRLEYSYMFYTSFFPWIVRPLYRVYYHFFMKGKQDAQFAVGLIGTGIFYNEPIYKNVSQMKRDIEFLKERNVKKIVVFELSAITKRGKEWLEVLKDYS